MECGFAGGLDLHQHWLVVLPHADEEAEVHMRVVVEHFIHQCGIEPFLSAAVARDLLQDLILGFEPFNLGAQGLKFSSDISHVGPPNSSQ